METWPWLRRSEEITGPGPDDEGAGSAWIRPPAATVRERQFPRGRMTVSMTWMIPLLAEMLGARMDAS